MKLMFASDIHGSAYYCKKMLQTYTDEQADKLILLGDLLYHGPRNDLPKEYAPKEVISLLNAKKEELLTVRGNCEAEVDQMVLDFPVLAEYAVLYDGCYTFFVTHGHHYNESNLPPMKAGDILIQGHTHIPEAKRVGAYYLLNPGSVSIPKAGSIPSYAVWEAGCFTIKGFDGRIVKQIQL